ncbi:MAG: alpha/beta hydrolase [Syntrophus sp. (in: bacteria)]|nr:alpha/beta hydrolase [Syntrophus sp. (in: bacteria)]
MRDVTRVFIHGLDSSSRGTKGTFFHERYPEMIMENFSGSLEQRMAQLERGLAAKSNLILVGSSYGGLMAAQFACKNESRTRRLILLSPALGHGDFNPYYEAPLELPVTLYHGRQDLVVPPGPTRRIAERLFRNLEIHLVDDDHNLHLVFPMLDWDMLLEMGESTPAGHR